MNSFPKVKREIQVNQVWFALFPYETLGNMEKLRPVLITKVNEDTVECKCITTNPNNATKIKGILAHGKHFRKFNQASYVKNRAVEIPKYKLYGMIKNKIELEVEYNV
jgi:hypothetical protein